MPIKDQRRLPVGLVRLPRRTLKRKAIRRHLRASMEKIQQTTNLRRSYRSLRGKTPQATQTRRDAYKFTLALKIKLQKTPIRKGAKHKRRLMGGRSSVKSLLLQLANGRNR